jgi:hypothetical protein
MDISLQRTSIVSNTSRCRRQACPGDPERQNAEQAESRWPPDQVRGPQAPPRPGRVRRDCPKIRKESEGHVSQIFSPDYLAAKFCIRQTATSGSCSLPIDQYLPSPRPSGGSLVIIGPGTGYQGQWLLWDPRWRGRVGSRAQMRRTCESPRRRAAPYRHHPRRGEVDLTAESLADDRHCGMNSLLFPNRRVPGRYRKFKTRRSCALRNQINAKPRSHSSIRQRPDRGAGRPAI